MIAIAHIGSTSLVYKRFQVFSNLSALCYLLPIYIMNVPLVKNLTSHASFLSTSNGVCPITDLVLK